MLALYIGNKNYSSWSMRPWVLMRQAGITFEEIKVRFDSFSLQSGFKQRLHTVSPAGRVPVLIDGDLAIWDSLAIAEYLAEQYPDKQLWPRLAPDRARARSICAEMHSGFTELRSHCPMNVEAHLPAAGAQIWSEQPGVRDDVQRLIDMWSALLSSHGGSLLFGHFTIADAYFAPVCLRLATYDLPVPPQIDAYIKRVRALPSVQEWVQDAMAEQDFIDFEEPYRERR